jgi:hypothetical protein
MLGSNATKSWSEADDRLLVELAQRGVSKARIAVQLRRTEIGVKRRASVLGVKIVAVARLPSPFSKPRSQSADWQAGQRVSRINSDELGTVVEADRQSK